MAAAFSGMTTTYDQKAEAQLSKTLVRVLRSGRARYGLSAGAPINACGTAMAVTASDAGVSDHQLGGGLHTIAVRSSAAIRTSTACSVEKRLCT